MRTLNRRLAHSARTPAPPPVVWELLGDPVRWPEFHPLVARVTGAHGPARAGQHLLVIGRGIGLRVPVDVLDADGERRLALLVHTAPGLRQVLTVELAPTLRGGSVVTATTTTDGPFAAAGVAPLWVADGVLVRLLARRATEEGRRAGRSGAA